MQPTKTQPQADRQTEPARNSQASEPPLDDQPPDAQTTQVQPTQPTRREGLRFLLRYAKPYRLALLLGTLYAIIGAGASAYSPTVLGNAVDYLDRLNELGEVIDGENLRTLGLYALALVGLAAVLAIFRYMLRMLTGRVAAGVSYQMSRDLFERLLGFDRETRQQYGTGDLLSRATSDFIYVWRFYSAGFQMSIHAFFLLIIGCLLMARSSPLLAGLIIVMLSISIAIQIRFGGSMRRAFERVQAEMASISEFAQEHLNAARMLRAYAQEKPVGTAFAQANQEYVQQNLSFVLRSGLISPLPRLMVQLAATVIIFVGGLLILNETLSIGVYVQFVFYLGLLSSGAQMITGSFERLQQGSAAAARIGELLDHDSRIHDEPDAKAVALKGHIRFDNVGVWAEDQNRWLLRNIDLEIPAGTTLGIVGPTGAGKSMLISLLGRIHDPDEGKVIIDGLDLRQIKLDALRRGVVYVPQETLLFTMLLRENIALGVPNTPEPTIWSAMQQARLTNDLPQLPHGLDSMVGERGTTLSGGQKQRTAIARALVRKPSVLLLDDALASVDMKTSAEIISELRAAQGKQTCVIVSQRLAAVQEADQIVVLDHGRIVERGTHAELLTQGGFYAEMYDREIEQAEDVAEPVAKPIAVEPAKEVAR